MSSFLVRIEFFDRLVEATSRLAQIAEEADVKFTPLMFWLIASHPSPRFTATLQMSHHCFTEFSVDEDHNFRVSLQSFHDALLDSGTSSSSMTIHLLENINQMILRFETTNHTPQMRQELVTSPSKEEDVEEVDYEKFFTIDSRELRRIIKELPIFHDDFVCVTVTDTQVKFSIASKEIIVAKKDGQCDIIGYEGEGQTQIRINLHPMLFFLNMAYDVYRIWFYKTLMNSYGVMSVPTFGFYAKYLIYFPQT